MISKTIKYRDFNGEDREDTFLFHLSLPEITRIHAIFGTEGIEKGIKKMVENESLDQILEFIEKILLDSVGEKTPDGRSFIKSKELRERFEYSEAYAVLFEELLSTNDPEPLSKFVEGLMAHSNKSNVKKFQPLKN